MTPTQLKEAAQVMVAAAEGKQVQFYERTRQEWQDIHNIGWDWGVHTYRIKPEPRTWWIKAGRLYTHLPIESEGFIKVREVIE